MLCKLYVPFCSQLLHHTIAFESFELYIILPKGRALWDWFGFDLVYEGSDLRIEGATGLWKISAWCLV